MKRVAFRGSWIKRAGDRRVLVATALFLACGLAACRRSAPVDTQALNNSGMAYDSVKQLQDMKVTAAEVAEILKMREAGFPDSDCVQVVQAFHGRGEQFDAGSAVAGMTQAGMSDKAILELASLNQLGLSAGELEAMHLAGLSDAIVLEVARHRAAGKPVLAGATLARLKNMGVRATTLLALAHRDISDSEAKEIVSWRKRGASDAQILRHFSGS
jgi:hypothetical protein